MEALRASSVVYADETGLETRRSSGLAVGLHEPARARYVGNFRAVVSEHGTHSVLGRAYAGTLGVDSWAPYRCFK